MELYIGIDWGNQTHAVVCMHPAGEVVLHFSIPHSLEGFLTLDRRRGQLDVPAADCVVALETHHNLLLDFLVDYGYQQFYVVPPSRMKAYRQRYRTNPSKSDQRDAWLLAELLRTDRPHLVAWQPPSAILQQLKAQVSYQAYLTKQVVRTTNRLRQLLWRYYPNATRIFSALDTQIALHFVRAYPTPAAGTALSLAEFTQFTQQYAYPRRKQIPRRYAALQAPQPAPNPHCVAQWAQEAQDLASTALQQVQQLRRLETTVYQRFLEHPDAPLYTSLPGAGQRLAPALLVKMGEDRQRFPRPAVLQAVAGTSPYTKTSGKYRKAYYRHACDKAFRRTVQQWARCSLEQSVWANSYYQQARPHARTDSEAYRKLAHRWLAILWRLWQDRQPYDEDYHLQQHAQRMQPR